MHVKEERDLAKVKTSKQLKRQRKKKTQSQEEKEAQGGPDLARALPFGC